MPERVHFFSYATGVSIELPVGFTAGPEAAGGVVYTERVDERMRAAVIVATVTGGPPGGAELLVDAMAGAAGEVLGRGSREIDDERVVVAELRFPHGLPSGGVAAAEPEVVALLGSDVLVTFAAVAFGGRLTTISAVAPYADAASYRPAFAEAIDSCRFIAVEAA